MSFASRCCMVALTRMCSRTFAETLHKMTDIQGLQEPKSMVRPEVWDEKVEEHYRFQVAGYRDAVEYKHVQKTENIDRWPDNGYVKKLVRRDGSFYYFNKTRECPDKEIHQTKVYTY
ncbi:meiosis expressed gene 1 protein homolog [Babylonia areolata]|uniref:meiosis expressed gene 1 protein homolog n=1 Tax=Babylonia areolata TaxID=304850 RepID=UPI003FD65D5B